MKENLTDIVDVIKGSLVGGKPDGVNVLGVSIDTRTIKKGDLFFAIKGENFNGNEYIEEALSKGAVGAVVDEDVNVDKSFVVLQVSDSIKSLGEFAKYYREKLKPKVIAITGSAGKTTTKDFIYSILEASGKKVVKTLGNYNNLIGLPLSIFRLEASTEYGVFELGINELGEMKRLAEICSPDVVVVTNIGRGHLEGLSTVEGVAEEKKELFGSVKSGGVVVVNADDIRLKNYEPAEGVKKVSFGLTGSSSELDVDIKNIAIEEEGLMVSYGARDMNLEVSMNSPYFCNAYNGAAAIASVIEFGINEKDIKRGLESYSQIEGRMSVINVSGITVINDTYNSNPESLKEALKALSSLSVPSGGRKIAVIGDMLELGGASKGLHVEMGRFAAGLGIDIVLGVGEYSAQIIEGAESGDNVKTFSALDSRGASSLVMDIVKEGDAVLVKGSRGIAMEVIVERLKNI